ncbi:MAG: hypothetical protein E6538_13335 [Paeniclostridium sordellii]|nr:hypothetical protein [Paeniclostridium sordellii]
MLEGVSALHEFYQKTNFNPKVFNAKVYVKSKKNKKNLFSKDIPIRVIYDGTSTRIEIYWDEADYEDYADMQLSMAYYAEKPGTKMQFIQSKNLLRIYKQGSNKIVEIEA